MNRVVIGVDPQIASIHVVRLRRIEPQALADYIHTHRSAYR
jgi:hypothetical protein